jgi:protein-tyrosine phosphatase
VIDMHNHILPGVDDGAADLAESVEIARSFAHEGVGQVVATPHFDPLHGRGPAAAAVAQLVADVQAAVYAAGIEVTIFAGMELFLTPEAVELVTNGTVCTLAGTRFILVEVSFSAIERPLYLDDTVFKLQVAGFQPILAHPERFPFVQRDVESVDGLVERGVPLQLTAPALLGEYGSTVRRTAEKLLERGAYRLAGSDRHHPGPKRSLADVYRLLSDAADPDLAELLLKTNPARVLAGKDPLAADALPYRRSSVLGRLFSKH